MKRLEILKVFKKIGDAIIVEVLGSGSLKVREGEAVVIELELISEVGDGDVSCVPANVFHQKGAEIEIFLEPRVDARLHPREYGV